MENEFEGTGEIFDASRHRFPEEFIWDPSRSGLYVTCGRRSYFLAKRYWPGQLWGGTSAEAATAIIDSLAHDPHSLAGKSASDAKRLLAAWIKGQEGAWGLSFVELQRMLRDG